MREYLIDLTAAGLFVLAGLAMAWRYERFRRRVDARLAAARQDDMAVADAVREVPAAELAGMCERDLVAYQRMRETADHRGVSVALLARMLDFALIEQSGPTQYADACNAITDELLAEISEAKREAARIDSAALHLELDSYTTEER